AVMARPLHPLLRGATLATDPSSRAARVSLSFFPFCFALTPINIAILFLTCNNFMYILGFFIYDSNEFPIARSFFVFSLLINGLAYFGMWRRKAGLVIPCFVVYLITFIINCFLSFIVIAFFSGYFISYEHFTRVIQDKLNLGYDASRHIARLFGYFSACNAAISCAYLWVLISALNTIRKEYGREQQVMKRVVVPSAPPAYDV
ncbi:hypothetical protein PENTCL1PPCAC_25138, partial [Pristionchus entomophagus]